MSARQIESAAARLRRLNQQITDIEYQVQQTKCPDQIRRLGVKLRDHREGLRLTQLKA